MAGRQARRKRQRPQRPADLDRRQQGLGLGDTDERGVDDRAARRGDCGCERSRARASVGRCDPTISVLLHIRLGESLRSIVQKAAAALEGESLGALIFVLRTFGGTIEAYHCKQSTCPTRKFSWPAAGRAGGDRLAKDRYCFLGSGTLLSCGRARKTIVT